MKLTTFIKRPILSSVISVLIVLAGILSLVSLPIERYPSIAPPTIEVSTNFYGANSETLLKSVITPLEEAINGVENMIYMSSSASNNGSATIQVVFKQGSDPNMCAVNVQNRVQKAMAQLPAEVKAAGVSVEKTENSMLQAFSVYSPDGSYDYEFLSNYASINIKPRVAVISGVGKFQMLGAEYSMRVWLDPQKMAQHNMVPSDVIEALATQNIEAATGSLGSNTNESFEYAMRYTGRKKNIEEFNDIVVHVDENGTILRLADVAKVELGVENYSMTGETNEHPGVMCLVYQATGSNATAVNKEIHEVLEQVRKDAPAGVEIANLIDSNDFLYAAIKQVLETLRDAIVLVILIVLMFLKDFRSTLIPFISIMVSLIGTFAFMMVAGFSINLLTLFALVLVIGTVVDDSIVVVEAVHSKFEKGITDPFKATKEATQEVTTAVITSSLVFMAVFLPVSMMGGTSGIFYRQFGLTMAVAVGISALNALTLVPALCAMILKPIKKLAPGEKGTIMERYARWFDNLFDKFSGKYKNGLKKVLNVKLLVWAACLGTLAGLVIFMKIMPSGLVPSEDQGSIIVEISTPPGTSLSTTSALVHDYCSHFKEIEGIDNFSTTTGYGFIAGASVSSAVAIIKLKPWDERSGESSLEGIYNKLQQLAQKYPDGTFTVFTLPMIPGYGNNSGIDMYVQDRRGGTTEELYETTIAFTEELAKRGVNCFVAFDMSFPQWEVSVDPAKCMRSGLTPKEVLDVLGTYYGSAYVNDVNLYSKVYKVMVQGNADTRRDEFSLENTFVRTADGQMAPLSNFVTLKRVFGPSVMKSFNKYPAINVSAGGSMSTGDALAVIRDCAQQTLPQGYTVDFAGMAREQNNQGSLGLILCLCIFIIYLLLAALYESIVIPLAVLLAVPMGLFGSYGISYLVGLDNNIYLQTGVIMLIGLLSKTAILITEYAAQRRKEGLSINDAAVDAAGARIRAIFMTAGTMVIGLFPMITSINGVGGMGNFSLGIGTIVGMTMGTIGLLYITPVLFTTFQKIQEKIKTKTYDDDDEKE